MSERVVESSVDEVPEIPEILEKVLLFSLDRAKTKMEAGEDIIPFTSLAVKETLFMESHPAEDEQGCFNLARHTVEHARGAQAYSFCYDGYVETDDGTHDALIAEGGVPSADKGFAVGQPLHAIVVDDGDFPESVRPLTVRERFERSLYMLHRHNITAVWSHGRQVK